MDFSDESITTLESTLGYRFKNKDLLNEAMSHPSLCIQFQDTNIKNNQRLEFLGDAVLSLILAEEVFILHPHEREGFLTQARSALAKRATLVTVARKLSLGEYLRMSDADRRVGNHTRETALEDALEAIVGAIYLDSDLGTARKCVLGWYGELASIIGQTLVSHNPKGRLQELLYRDGHNVSIDYRLVEIQGPEHGKKFITELWINEVFHGRGSGSSKKESEENAAVEALEKIEVANTN